MPLDIPTIFAALAIFAAALAYTSYFWAIYKGEAVPHFFSRFLWALVTGIGAFAQLTIDKTGLSGWILLIVSGANSLIAIYALFKGTRYITKSDWFALILALLAIIIWQITSDAFYAVIIIVIIDCLSYYPTFRKSWFKPWEEPVLSFFLAGLRYFLMLFTIETFTFEAFLYPVFLMVSDWGFVLYLLWRRHILSNSNVQ